jgi:hypothetical protein
MGRYPAEIAEGAEVYWEGGKGTYIGAVFNICLGLLKRSIQKNHKLVGIRAWILSTPKAKSKTPPRPLRETFRIRMVGKVQATAPQRGFSSSGSEVGTLISSRIRS